MPSPVKAIPPPNEPALLLPISVLLTDTLMVLPAPAEMKIPPPAPPKALLNVIIS